MQILSARTHSGHFSPSEEMESERGNQGLKSIFSLLSHLPASSESCSARARGIVLALWGGNPGRAGLIFDWQPCFLSWKSAAELRGLNETTEWRYIQPRLSYLKVPPLRCLVQSSEFSSRLPWRKARLSIKYRARPAWFPSPKCHVILMHRMKCKPMYFE